MENYSYILQYLVVGSSLAAGSLYADLPAYDDFDYTTNTTLASANGGSGWNSAWTTSTAVTVESTATTVSFTDGDGNVYGGGNSVAFSEKAGSPNGSQNAASRSFLSVEDTNQTGDDFFFSYVINVTDSANASATGAVAGSFVSVGVLDSDFNVSNDNSIAFRNGRVSARGNGAETSLAGAGGLLQYGTSYLVVGRLSGWDGNSYNTTTVWLDPNSDDFGNSTISVSNTSTDGGDGFRGITFRTYQLGTNVFNFDDIRMGETWDAVVIPETSSAGVGVGLVGLMATMMLRRRQK